MSPCASLLRRVPVCHRAPPCSQVTPHLSGPCCVPMSPGEPRDPDTFPGYLMHLKALPCPPSCHPYLRLLPCSRATTAHPMVPSHCRLPQVPAMSPRVPSPPWVPVGVLLITPSTLPEPLPLLCGCDGTWHCWATGQHVMELAKSPSFSRISVKNNLQSSY